jgi:hypothetical protein
MKKATWLSIAAFFFFLCGCGEEKPSKAAAPSSGNPLTAPADYLDAVGKAQKSANKTLGGVGLDQAVKTFYTEHGRLPKDLNELVSQGTLKELPPAPRGMKFDYDAKTGAVKVVPE